MNHCASLHAQAMTLEQEIALGNLVLHARALVDASHRWQRRPYEMPECKAISLERLIEASSELVEAYMRRRKVGFRADQPRAPAGSPDGGQWVDWGDSSGGRSGLSIENYRGAPDLPIEQVYPIDAAIGALGALAVGVTGGAGVVPELTDSTFQISCLLAWPASFSGFE